MTPLEGEAFLHSQMKLIPGCFSAFSKGKPVSQSIFLARLAISAGETIFMEFWTRILASSARVLRILPLIGWTPP